MSRPALAVRSNQEKRSLNVVSPLAATKGGSWSREGSDTGTRPALASFVSQICRHFEVNQISRFRSHHYFNRKQCLDSLNPAADVTAPQWRFIDLSGLGTGERITVVWSGTPVFIVRPTDL